MLWCVIRTKPHQERLVHLHLSQLCEETFMPLLKHAKTFRCRDTTVIAPQRVVSEVLKALA